LEVNVIRVLVGESKAVLRAGLRLILAQIADIYVDAEAFDAIQLLQRVHNEAWDVVLLDLDMPARGGHFTLLRELKRIRRRVPVLALLPHPEDCYGMLALEAGASGCITAESAPDEIADGIRKLAGGLMYVTSALAQALARRVGRPEGGGQRHETLSEREFEVFLSLASGVTLTDIASNLMLSTKTVSTYRARVLAKMNVVSNAQITQYALENELIGACMQFTCPVAWTSRCQRDGGEPRPRTLVT
jgi:two-component system invasion response regulator UvrY